MLPLNQVIETRHLLSEDDIIAIQYTHWDLVGELCYGIKTAIRFFRFKILHQFSPVAKEIIYFCFAIEEWPSKISSITQRLAGGFSILIIQGAIRRPHTYSSVHTTCNVIFLQGVYIVIMMSGLASTFIQNNEC